MSSIEPAASGRPRISVVIPTFGAPHSVRNAVLSLFEQDLPKDAYEIIVVDSTPDDGVAAVVTELQASAPCALRLYRKKPEGPGPSRNLGAREARGDIIALMDSDCLATPAWLREGEQAFTEGVGLVQGRTLPDPATPTGIFTWYVRVESENHVYEAANIFYRRDAFMAVGGFLDDYNDPAEFIMGGEDVDLAWRVKAAGWKSRFCNAALVYHEVQPIPISRWIYIKRLYIWPLLARRFPQLRDYFYARYFLDRNQAFTVLGLLGGACAVLHPAALALALPYVISRSSEPTRTLRGIRRPLRALLYLPRDLTSLGILTAASIRYRSMLL